MTISFGNINGAVSSNVYRGQDKPWYTLGHGIVLMYIGIGLISATVFKIYLKNENRKRESGERNEFIKGVNDELATSPQTGYFNKGIFKIGKDVYDSVEDVKQVKGDKWSGYRYAT